jgi:hypothetical protein
MGSKNHFTYYIIPPTEKVEDDTSQHWATSGKKPFLGFTTRTGMTSPTVNIIKHDPLLESQESLRGFGCKTYEDCARSLAQERNAMRFLDIFSDEQAMTLGELELTKKLYAFRVLCKAYPGYRKISILVDSTGWNNKQRDEAVGPICSEVLDPLFGTKTYNRSHRFCTLQLYSQIRVTAITKATGHCAFKLTPF